MWIYCNGDEFSETYRCEKCGHRLEINLEISREDLPCLLYTSTGAFLYGIQIFHIASVTMIDFKIKGGKIMENQVVHGSKRLKSFRHSQEV